MHRPRMILAATVLVAGLFAPVPARAADATAGEIAEKMGSVVDNLGRKQTGDPVQGEQKEIVSDLDALIASLERESANTRGGIKRKGPGMTDSIISRGSGETGPMSGVDEGGKDWGKLTDRERDRIIQSMSEGFPPEYRTVLERYYRRLAEEKSAKAGGPGASVKTKAQAQPGEAAGQP